MTTLTQTLSKFIVDTGFDDLPQAVVERAKHHILDGIGVMLAGSQHQISRKVLRYVASLGGKPQATAIGSEFKIAADQAAFVNATMGHVLDFDDDSDTMVSHPTVTILPAIMALGEDTASGEDLLTAYILGLEVCARIASAPGFLPEHYRRGWHTTSTLGVINATAGCAKIKGLDGPQVQSALGIAASEASGLRVNFGSMVKAVHAGSASAKGVHCTLLAKAGISANQDIFDCAYGFYDLYGGLSEIDAYTVLAGLGRRYDIITPGINIKKYPCCFYTHAAIDALLFIMEKHGLAPQDIETIRCSISSIAYDVLQYGDPTNGTEAKLSMPYCLARALLHKRVSIDDFDDDIVRDQQNHELMQKVKLRVDAAMDEPGNSLGVQLSVQCESGQTYEHEILKALGGCENPLPWEAVVSKFKTCAHRVMDEASAAAIVGDIENLENVSRIRALIKKLIS
jgi:2-methylcitrate dehydratase PrpD